MQTIRRGTCVLLLLAPVCLPAGARAGQEQAYETLKQQLEAEDAQLRQRLIRTAPPASRRAELRRRLLRRIDGLFQRWEGSRWGLGLPQSTVPHRGKTNCGLFVAVVLRDAGFRLPIWKFNRQAAYDGIRSLAPRRAIRYLHGTSMAQLTAAVRRMGPGLYLIGLDFHIGFLRVTSRGDVRFVHSSYVTKRVEDEPAATSAPIVQSRSRMVGKLLEEGMLRAWMQRRRLRVRGHR